ncbi:universal stress protein [Arthrobacter sp.]|uniref:universal stress protein n=1 Tax=Arthrobacter sp. TaxID=1667 RepID=UPI003A8E6DF0
MRYIVGYTADARGAEAVRLALALGGGLSGGGEATHLDIAMILPEHTPFSATYPGGDHGYRSIIAEQVDAWANEALQLVPAGVSARAVVRSAPSEAEGLDDLARESGAGLIVIGGRQGKVAARMGPGSVAAALLHSASIPVAMAPVGDGGAIPRGLDRVTAFIGTRPGATAVVETAAVAARRRGAELRVVSLLGQDGGNETQLASRRAELQDHVAAVVHEAGIRAETIVAEGRNIEEAVQALQWQRDEVAVVGSSRLAHRRRLFLGATAQRMLRTLAVPMVVVPRDHQPPAPDRT